MESECKLLEEQQPKIVPADPVAGPDQKPGQSQIGSPKMKSSQNDNTTQGCCQEKQEKKVSEQAKKRLLKPKAAKNDGDEGFKEDIDPAVLDQVDWMRIVLDVDGRDVVADLRFLRSDSTEECPQLLSASPVDVIFEPFSRPLHRERKLSLAGSSYEEVF